MQSVIGRLDDDVMRMVIDSVDEASKSRLLGGEPAEEQGAGTNTSAEEQDAGTNTSAKEQDAESGVEKVKEYFKQFGMEDRVLEFNVSSATVELAAKAVGCEPACIVKTLSFKVGDRPILVACAGDTKIANPKYKAEFGQKAKMLTPDEAIELVGHAVGGVCPFAVKDGVEVYLDESIKRFETVYPAAGSDNSAIGLTPDELEKYAQGFVRWVDVCKGWDD